MSTRRTRRTRGTALALAVALAVVAAGCGVSTNDDPQPIARENVPADLLEAETDSGDEAVTAEDGSQLVHVFFLVEEDESTELLAVDRYVPWPAQAARRIDQLLTTEDNPTVDERDDGISTAIPPGSRLTALPTQEGSVLEVSLSEDFYVRGGNNFIRAVAQVVFTATEITSVDAVRFIGEDGEQVSVLDGEGEARDAPVGRDDYADLDPNADTTGGNE